MTKEGVMAANRFGYGLLPNQNLPANPKLWLLAQLDSYSPSPAAISSQPTQAALMEELLNYQIESKELREARKDKANTEMLAEQEQGRKMARKEIRQVYFDAVEMRLDAARTTETPFAERLVHFWANHFAISSEKPQVSIFAGHHELSAIRLNLMGKFSSLLSAAVLHPAMLTYLDQSSSIGPNSPAALRARVRAGRERGLNENLAREILELHTLGVRSGYSQADVTEFARALTGWTVAKESDGGIQRRRPAARTEAGDPTFLANRHEPGVRKIIGRNYPHNGAQQARAVLADLAVHPATARHIAHKLATHFVTDQPAASLVKRLEENFLATGGDLKSLYRTLIESPESWDVKAVKFKSPWDWTISAMRATGMKRLPDRLKIGQLQQQLGQPVWQPGSPAGFADRKEQWAGSAAIMRRFELANRFARLSANGVDARQLAVHLLGDRLTQNTAQVIARAESPEQGLALLLVSPEFMRR